MRKSISGKEGKARKVRAWNVPLLVRELPDQRGWTWDLVLERVHPFVDGVNHIKRIARLADVDMKLVKKAIWELVLHERVMLLDIYLPDMTGIDVLREVRRSFPALDVLVVTAARELDTVRDAQQGGAVSYLVKPFEYSALGVRLEHYRRTLRLLAADDGQPVDQQQIDRLFGGSPAAGDQRFDLPKGLSRETADAVRALLLTSVALSVGGSRV